MHGFPGFWDSIPKRCKGVHFVDLGESFPTQIDPNSNAYLLAKIVVDTAENEPCKVCPLSVYRSPRWTSAKVWTFLKEVSAIVVVRVKRVNLSLWSFSKVPPVCMLVRFPMQRNELLLSYDWKLRMQKHVRSEQELSCARRAKRSLSLVSPFRCWLVGCLFACASSLLSNW